MNEPLISVVMSVYNGEKYIKEAIESILGQSFNDFEFIIIDDGSKDNSVAIIQEYQEANGRIKLIKNQENLGLTKSLNKAIAAAKGKFIARQDADDISLPQRLKKQINHFYKYKKCVLVGCNCVIIDNQGNELRKTNYYKEGIKERMLKGNSFTHGAVVFSKETFDLLGGYREAFAYAQDYDFFSRIVEKYDIDYVNEPLYKWRDNTSGISRIKIIDQLQNTMLIRTFIFERRKSGKDSYNIFSRSKLDVFLLNYEYSGLYHYLYGRALFSLDQFEDARDNLKQAKGFLLAKPFIFMSYLGAVCSFLRRLKDLLLMRKEIRIK